MPRLSGMSEATGPEKFNNSSKEIKCVRKRKISTTVCREQSQGNKIFYEEYHDTEEDVIAGLCENEKIRELIY